MPFLVAARTQGRLRAPDTVALVATSALVAPMLGQPRVGIAKWVGVLDGHAIGAAGHDGIARQ